MEIFNRKEHLGKYENVQYVTACYSLSGPAQGPGPGRRSYIVLCVARGATNRPNRKKLVFRLYKFRILCTDFCEHLDIE